MKQNRTQLSFSFINIHAQLLHIHIRRNTPTGLTCKKASSGKKVICNK